MMSGNFSTVTAILLACSLLFASCAGKRDTSPAPIPTVKTPVQKRDETKKPVDPASPPGIHARAAKALKDGRFADARAEFTKIAVSGYILEDYAALGLAQSGIGAGNAEGILPVLDGVLERYPESPIREKIDGARLAIACVDETSAICADYLEKIRAGRVMSGFEPELLYVSARRMERAGETLEAYKEYQKIYFGHPVSTAAEKAGQSMRAIEKSNRESGTKTKLPAASFESKMERIDKLEAARKFALAAEELSATLKEAPKHETPRLLYKLGMSLKKTRDKEGARKAFQKLLSKGGGGPYGGMAAYQMALIEWNEDLDKPAQNRLLKALKGNHGKEVNKLCHLLMGKIYESQNNFKSASVHYARALELTAPGAESAELDWRVCWMEYRMGNMKEAGRRFLEAHKRAPEAERDGAFLYWAARAYEKAGSDKEADKTRKRLTDGFPETYYGAKVADGAYTPAPVPVSLPPQPDAPVAKPSLDARGAKLLERCNALNDIGNAEGARLEVFSLAGLIGDDYNSLLWLSSLYSQSGDIPSAIKTAWRATDKIPKQSRKNYSDPAWKALYPTAYWEVVSRESVKNGLDPFLTLSLIRQESMFDQRAVSSASARGLMQLMPATGKMTHDSLAKDGSGPERFDEDSLFDPETNIRLGSAHFASLTGKYKGNMIRSIAAYNAGAIAVDKWMGRFGQVEDDEFVERIPYLETRGYVKKVLRNAALYRRIYSGGASGGGNASAGQGNMVSDVSGSLSLATKAGEGRGEGN